VKFILKAKNKTEKIEERIIYKIKAKELIQHS